MSSQPAVQPAPARGPLMTRYTDAYRVARTIKNVGDAIKVIALSAGILIFMIGMVGSSQSLLGAMPFFGGLVSGAIVAGVGFILGTLVSAQGQVLKATLDTAVYSCPFLVNEQRAEIMHLS